LRAGRRNTASEGDSQVTIALACEVLVTDHTNGSRTNMIGLPISKKVVFRKRQHVRWSLEGANTIISIRVHHLNVEAMVKIAA
jgi:hypothetical protein